MTFEEKDAIDLFPRGHKHTLLFIAYAKHALVNLKMRAGERLQFLEWIDSCVCLTVTREMVEIIQPASVTEMRMIAEAQSLSRDDDRGGFASYKVLTSEEVFAEFLALNPSLLRAIVMAYENFGYGQKQEQAA
jgi:hypothetical protein